MKRIFIKIGTSISNVIKGIITGVGRTILKVLGFIVGGVIYITTDLIPNLLFTIAIYLLAFIIYVVPTILGIGFLISIPRIIIWILDFLMSLGIDVQGVVIVVGLVSFWVGVQIYKLYFKAILELLGIDTSDW